MQQRYTYLIIFLSSILLLSCGAKSALYMPDNISIPDKDTSAYPNT